MFRKRWYVFIAAGLCALYFYCSLDSSLPNFIRNRRLASSYLDLPMTDEEDGEEWMDSNTNNRLASSYFDLPMKGDEEDGEEWMDSNTNNRLASSYLDLPMKGDEEDGEEWMDSNTNNSRSEVNTSTLAPSLPTTEDEEDGEEWMDSNTNNSRSEVNTSSLAPQTRRKDEEDEQEWIESNIYNRTAIIMFLESNLRKALKYDKGTGCHIPHLDPFSRDIAWTYKKLGPLKCKGEDWVKCYHSKCRVVDSIRKSHTDIKCVYKDIIYETDSTYTIGNSTIIKGGNSYQLSASDFVSVSCTGTRSSTCKHMKTRDKWSGNTLGFRPISPPAKPSGDQINVMILGFDSTPRSGFIRLMPKSWRVIKEELKATVMEGYNVLGDGTPFALFPILTGKTELEQPDVRRKYGNQRTLDDFPFIFKHLKEEGYVTAYFEDMPLEQTFQFRFNGFNKQPADHYMRAFRLANKHLIKGWNFCLGEAPQFKMMMNMTEQFLELEGRRFIFTFIGDITHDNFNYIQYADDDTAAFLKRLLKRTEDTLIIVMGDHGPRYAAIRIQHSLRGKLDERLPLLAIRLPDRLTRARPDAQSALEANARVLTTAHDLHATILDVLNLRKHWNPYKVDGADLKRGLTMLEPIPSSRACSEAGIEAHWCTCLVWQNVSISDPLYNRTAAALIDYINKFTQVAGPQCTPRTIASVSWVLRQRANNRLLSFDQAIDYEAYLGRFNNKTVVTIENYQIGIKSNPGGAVYEASLTYNIEDDKLFVHSRDISRINAYRGESDCILESHPHLAPYCYCTS